MMTPLGLVGTTVGSLALGLSFVWTIVFPPERQWTEDQAKEHQQASAKVHQLQHMVGGHSHGKQPAAARTASQPTQADLDAARSHYEKTRAGLETARSEGRHTALWLRYGGVVIAALGVAGLAVDKRRASKCVPKRDPFTHA
jgi:hypothetical protein